MMKDVRRRRASASAILLLGAALSWAEMMRASFRTLYVEPTDEAVARAAAARPAGVLAAVLLVAFVLSAAAVVRRPWVMVLALPGALAGGWLLLVPDAHGAAFLYGLGASLVGVIIAAVKVSAGGGRRRR